MTLLARRISGALLFFALAASAQAQPPAASEAAPNPSNWMPAGMKPDAAYVQSVRSLEKMAPAAVVMTFLKWTQTGRWQQAALCVAGADPTSPFMARLPPLTVDLRRMHGTAVDAELLAREDWRNVGDVGATMELDVPLISRDSLRVETRTKEHVQLRREKITWNKNDLVNAGEATIWRIVTVPRPEPGPDTPRQTELEKLGVIAGYAGILANPLEGWDVLGRRRAVARGKALASAVYEYVDQQSWTPNKPDWKIDLTQANVREKLGPFLHDPDAFTAPGDVAGVQSFTFNDALTGKKWNDLADYKPGGIVLFYLGKNRRLDTRYFGMGTIVYLQGSARSALAFREGDDIWDPIPAKR